MDPATESPFPNLVGPKNSLLSLGAPIVTKFVLRNVGPEKYRGIRLRPRVLVEPGPFLAGRLPLIGLVEIVDCRTSRKNQRKEINWYISC